MFCKNINLLAGKPIKPQKVKQLKKPNGNMSNFLTERRAKEMLKEKEKDKDQDQERIKELETHFTHLKIEINENVLSEEKMDSQDKRNDSE